MDTKQISDALDRLFSEEGARIVFWNDPDQEFQNVLPFVMLDDVTTLRLDEVGALETKIRLEKDDPTGKYLLYAPTEEPDYEHDWLLDVRLYSRSFRADRASILLDQLGLQNHHLRQHLADRRKFFDSKDRLQKLRNLVAADDIADDLDRKMMAVAVKADQPEFFNIVRTLFAGGEERVEGSGQRAEGGGQRREGRKVEGRGQRAVGSGEEEDEGVQAADSAWGWAQIEKFDLAPSFWRLAKTHFGYEDATPALSKLLIRLLVTDFAHHLHRDVPAAIAHFVLPAQGRANAVVCLAQWRDSSSRASSYDRLSAEVAAMLGLEGMLQGLEVGDLVDVMTFLAAEQAIASQLRQRVEATAQTLNPDDIRTVALRRQAGHWASPHAVGAAEVPRLALNQVYEALVAAADLFHLRNQHQAGFNFADALSLYRAYEQDLYRFDQLYRHFCEAADHAEAKGWNILKALREAVEDCYAHWFLPTLGVAWGRFVASPSGTALLSTWRLEGVPSQQRFFERHVRPRLEEAENRRSYVIISDAFRYEAAAELVRELNGKYRFEAKLTSQLGVLPSYTPLGMASLLPHQILSYKPNGDVLVDGMPTTSLALRSEILSGVDGMACRADDLLPMKRDEARALVRDRRVVYIYHNAVDAIGESAEEQTFAGVRKAIDDLAALVSFVINKLNGSQVIVTADHGFLFTESPPGEPEKSKLDQKPAGTVKAKQRYLIGHALPDHEAVWRGRTAVTAGAAGDMEFWIPRSANRFHFSGGARFVHGGAMLQEIVVPVITVKEIEGKAAKGTKTKTVAVHVLGNSHKITTASHRFELIQTEPVSDRVKPVTLKVAVYEGDAPVTNVETVTFESASDKMDQRKQWVRLVLQDRDYDKKAAYRLVLRDAETGIEQQSVPVVIDRAFSDDF